MNNLLLIKLLGELKQMQCELMAVKCNRDEWKAEAQRLRAIEREGTYGLYFNRASQSYTDAQNG